jgi:hypothetical protein
LLTSEQATTKKPLKWRNFSNYSQRTVLQVELRSIDREPLRI